MTTIVSTVPAVAHAEMMVAAVVRAIDSVVMSIVAAAMITPAMSSTIGAIEVRTTEVEVATVRIAGVNAEVPVTCIPVERTVEIGCCTEQLPLPAVEYIVKVGITTLPVCAKDIVSAGDTHQIIKIYLIGSLIL